MVQLNKSKKSGLIGGVLFGLIFFGVGSGFMWFMGLKPIMLSFQADHWHIVGCTITRSYVDSKRGDDGTAYKAIINVSYEINNQRFNGGSYNFDESYSSGRSGKRDIVKRYPVGQDVECWVNPENPSQAVLNKDIPTMVWFIIPFTSIFVLVGAAAILGTLGLVPKINLNTTRYKPVSMNQQGFTELKPRYGVKKKLGFSLVFSLFWNGIVSVFVYQIWQDFQRGEPEWGLVIFISIFVLVGIGTIIWVIYNLLALSNPQPTLHVTEGRPELGERIRVSWAFTGNIKKISQLNISLEGCEKATYRVGTDTRTDTHVFYQEELISVASPSAHSQLYTNVTIPENSMHSFDASNNKVEWQLKLVGQIPHWPDINYEYPIVIRPSKK